MAKVKLEEVFKLTGRGIVLVVSFQDNETISIGDAFYFLNRTFIIEDIGMFTYVSDRIGLVIPTSDLILDLTKEVFLEHVGEIIEIHKNPLTT